jgi:hypothetical protein
VSGPDKGRPDPNATIQLDQLAGLEDVELVDSEAPDTSPAAANRGRETPPPLPPTAPPPTSGPGAGRMVVYGALILAVVAAAIAAGLVVGNRVRSGSPTAPASSTTVAAPSAAPTAPPSSSTLVLPPVEIGTH